MDVGKMMREKLSIIMTAINVLQIIKINFISQILSTSHVEKKKNL